MTTAKTPAKKTPSRVLRPGRQVSAQAAAPLYQQVVAALREEILGGLYPVGSKLPSEEELTQRFGVSRHTVREALRQLRTDGLVSSRRGAGTTIERPAGSQRYVHEVHSITDLISYASSFSYKVDDQRLVAGDPQLGELVGEPGTQKWLRVEGLRYADDAPAPVCWTKIYIHGKYANVGRLIGRARGAVYELIEDLHGVRVAQVTQVVKATPCPAHLAARLQVDEGSTLIEVVRCYRLADGAVAEVAVNYFPADRFTLSMTLRRAP